MIFESAIICATVGLMCPTMSFLAALLYYPYYNGFHIITLLANWLKLVCFNFPFAYFTQLFFIQPLVRTIFKFLFRNDIQQRVQSAQETPKPCNEIEAIEDIMKRVEEIQKDLAREYEKQSAK